jgi:hypothetical protein
MHNNAINLDNEKSGAPSSPRFSLSVMANVESGRSELA